MKTYRVFRTCPHCRKRYPFSTKHIEHCQKAKERRKLGNDERREALERMAQ